MPFGHAAARRSANRPARDADRARPLDPCDLPDRRADRPGRSRNHHGLARLGGSDLQQPGVGGHARHAEHAERGLDRRDGRVELAQP
jgi:hypothetical protein